MSKTRILIYASDEVKDSAGGAIDQALVSVEANGKRSTWLRGMGAKQVTEMDLEIVLRTANAADSMQIQFYIEKSMDDDGEGSIWSQPTSRDCSITPASYAFPRVQDNQVFAGLLSHADLRHQVTLTSQKPVLIENIRVKAPWIRVGPLWVSGTIPAGAILDIWAWVGGHDEFKQIRELTRPYAYNVNTP